MKDFLRRQPPGRIIALGFAAVILLGSGLLVLPCSVRPGQTLRYIDALYTATSAVCVTGLVSIDPGTAFTPLGQFILGALIQVGGLGVTAVGAGVIMLMGKRINLKGRNLIREASNLDSGKGVVRFLRSVLLTTLAIELMGALLSFPVFFRDYPLWEAIGHSAFHAVAAFNNSGFDNLGLSGSISSNVNLIPYGDDLLLNAVTATLIILGGIGFLVMREVWEKRFRWKKFSMHTRVVLSMTAILLVSGAVLLKLTEEISWMGAFFFSVSARTAGFSTHDMGAFTNAGLLTMCVLMFIGASPGSTGGGIKTTTFFVLLQGIKSAATNKSEKVFRYAIPSNAFRKAAVIALLGLSVVIAGSFLIAIMEPALPMIDILTEVVSAFATVGLSTGITPGLSLGSKLLSILIMYIGRLGPLTVATLWYFDKGERIRYPEGNIAIG